MAHSLSSNHDHEPSSDDSPGFANVQALNAPYASTARGNGDLTDQYVAMQDDDAIAAWMRTSLDALIKLIENVVPGMRGSVLLLDDDGVTLRHGAAPHLPEAYCRLIDGEQIGPVAGSCGTAAYRRERVIVRDIATDPLWAVYRKVAEPFGLAASWSTPIFDSERRLLGTFAMYYSEPRDPTAADIALTETATMLSANIITRARAAKALRARTESAEQLARTLRQREDELQSSHARLRAAIQASSTATWQWDIASGTVDCDEGMFELFGIDPAVAAGSFDLFVSRIHPADRDRVIASAGRCAAEGADLNEEYRIVRPDGSLRWAVDRGRVIRDDDGAPRSVIGACVDVTERQEAAQAVRESEAKLRRLADSGIVGVFYWTMAGAITEANAEFRRMLGITEEDVRGGCVSWRSLTPDEWTGVDGVKEAELTASGVTVNWEKEFLASDGRRVPVVIGAALLEGSTDTGIALCLDISERKRAERERERLLESEHTAREAAERASRIRDEVLAVVAHDLRNPVHTISLSVGNLREIPMDEPTRQRQLAVIQRTAKTMERLIRDLLDATRIEAGTFAVRQGRVHVRALMDETLELFEAPARERKITLRCEADDDVPPVQGDRDRLAQVLSNLIGNALKFTPVGGDIRVSARALGDADVHTGTEAAGSPPARAVEISVTDTGGGIPAEQLAHVFDRFWQADRQGRAGAGLGLSIVKGIVEAHDGAIHVESVVGQGTTFRFTVPLASRLTGSIRPQL